MQAEELKAALQSISELTENKKELANLAKSIRMDASATRKLWRENNKSKLIKLGLALIVLPEPTPVSCIVGACLAATGAVQQGIRNRALFMEDIPKTLQGTIKEVCAAKLNLQI